MIGYGKQSLNEKEISAVINVLKNDFLTQGPKILEFEKLLKSKFGSKYCSVVSSGTAALHLAGMALGWKEKNIVITTPLTFLASSNSILYCNAEPFFVDIDANTCCIDIDKLEYSIKKLKKNNKIIKSIIGVDFAGLPCDWESINYLSKKYNLTLINDNCHAIGASLNNNFAYASKYADIVTHSYHPVKNITTAEGGSVFSNNLKIDKKIKLLRNHGLLRDISKQKINGRWFSEMLELGYNYRLTDLQAAIGIVQIKKLDSFIKKRKKIANYYNKIFKQYEEFKIPLNNDSFGHAYHLYVLKFNFKKNKKNKKNFFNFMFSKGINLQVHYKPVHLNPFYIKKFGFKKNDYPISENHYFESFSLPIYPDLKVSEMENVAKNIIKYLIKS